ncbi:TetR/AcrR family transcriptional regulator [Cribrihabitans sp. XS_ASV171]
MAQARRKDEKLRDVSRRMILERTARLLVRNGYGDTSLRDIAQACDMKAGSLYYHFEGKDALIEQVMTEGVRRVQARVRDALDAAADAAPLDRVRLAMEVHLATLHDKSDYASAHIRCFPHVPADVRQRLRSVREDYEAVWIDLLEAARAAGCIAPDVDLVTLRFALIGMMNWTLEWPRVAGTCPTDLADRFFRIAFEGASHPVPPNG